MIEDNSLYKDLENDVKKKMEIYTEKMLMRLIDQGYSKEIMEMFPPSKKIILLKYFSYMFLIGSIISYFFMHSFLTSIALLIFGILCYWLHGLIRCIQLKKMILSNEEDIIKFQNLFKKLYAKATLEGDRDNL